MQQNIYVCNRNYMYVTKNIYVQQKLNYIYATKNYLCARQKLEKI